MSGRELFSRYEKPLKAVISIVNIIPRKIRSRFFSFCRNTDGAVGIVLRYILIAGLAKKVGNNVSIFPGCYLKYLENLEIGDNVSIQPMCFLGCGGGLK